MDKLKNQLKQYELDGNVRFIGSRPNIFKYFQAADMFLLTSRLDPFPYVVLHAMEAEIPVVCFKGTTGAESLFYDGKAGFAVNKFDTSAAVEKLWFYCKDENARRNSGQKARQRLEERFSYEDYAQYLLHTSHTVNGRERVFEHQ